MVEYTIIFDKGASETSSSEPDQNGASMIEPKETKHKGSLEDIRITLPSTLVAEEGKKGLLLIMNNTAKPEDAFFKKALRSYIFFRLQRSCGMH